MFRLSALALIGALSITTGADRHATLGVAPQFPADPAVARLMTPVPDDGQETLAIYYTPLKSTEVSRYVGFGTAYHMALVYTDRAGRSYGASSGPSNLRSPQTPANAFNAIVYMASDRPSSFGTLVADPRNDTAFVIRGAGDFYTHDTRGHDYPHAAVMRGRDLSARWASIVRTYARIGRLGLTYSPMDQNSNSVAATALRRAGIGLDFSSNSLFVPGAFTRLP